MNKLVKGSIAGAAGIALLLGGAGTLAYWNDSATLSGAGTVTAGTLDLGTAADGVWTATNGSITTTDVDIDGFLIVPGDTLTFTQTIPVSATGNNLRFEVGNNIVPAVQSFATVAQNVVVKDSENAPVTTPTLGAGDYTIEVTVTVTFPFNASPTALDNDSQGETIDLSDAKITVTQVTNS